MYVNRIGTKGMTVYFEEVEHEDNILYSAVGYCAVATPCYSSMTAAS